MKVLVNRVVLDGVTWETWRFEDHLVATDPDGTEHRITGTLVQADAGQLDLGLVQRSVRGGSVHQLVADEMHAWAPGDAVHVEVQPPPLVPASVPMDEQVRAAARAAVARCDAERAWWKRTGLDGAVAAATTVVDAAIDRWALAAQRAAEHEP